MREDQYTITEWANKTFGLAKSNVGTASRANEEMAELIDKLINFPEDSKEALEEIADIYIVLCRLATNLGGDINQAVQIKMEINRRRQWNLNFNGNGYHVKE